MRIDKYLVEHNLFSTRNKAQDALKNGLVSVNGKVVNKAGYEIKEGDTVVVQDDESSQYVSRSGMKLEKALETFQIDPANMVGLDIGASTGGFSQCLVKHGASYVYALDVGFDQLHPSLREMAQIESREGVNCRYLEKSDFDKSIDIVVMDVSFISCTKMFDSIGKVLESGKCAVILIKPQFELPDLSRNKKGVIQPTEKEMIELCHKIEHEADGVGLALQAITLSSVKGKEGNQELLAYFIKDGQKQKIYWDTVFPKR